MIAGTLAALSLLFLAQAAIPNCTSHAAMLDFLSLRYKEKIVAQSITNQGLLVEQLENPVTKTWSIILTEPGGLTCYKLGGTDWRVAPKPTPGTKM